MRSMATRDVGQSKFPGAGGELPHRLPLMINACKLAAGLNS